MDLADALKMFNISDEVKESIENPKVDYKKILF
jgi:hypothetical protein